VRAPARHVSQAVNSRFGVNVAAWINMRRAEAAGQMIRQTADAPMAMTAIMMAAGFGSKSAFQREFRKHFGITPSEYRGRSESTDGSTAR
jgi:AraC-like DNA-binding protein